MRSRILGGALLLVVVSSAAGAAQPMRCSHQLPQSHHIADVIERWAVEVEALSAGEIDVRVSGDGALAGARENVAAVTEGRIECAFSLNFQWGRELPLMNVTLKPYAVTSVQALSAWPGSPAAQLLEKALLERGLRNVAWLFTTRMSAFTSKGRALIRPADFKGVRIRGLNPLVDAGLAALGALPTAVAGSQVRDALASGLVDAAVMDLGTVATHAYYEIQDRVTASALFSVYFHGYVNSAWHDGLSESARNALAAAGRLAARWALESSEAVAGTALFEIAAKNVQVHIHTAEEEAAMAAIMGPAFDKAFLGATGAQGRVLLERLARGH